jgi:hypothetical protein
VSNATKKWSEEKWTKFRSELARWAAIVSDTEAEPDARKNAGRMMVRVAWNTRAHLIDELRESRKDE